MHIGVFDVLNKVLFEKLTGDVSKNTIFLQVFKFFCICFQTLLFFCWPFLLLVLNFCVFLFCFSCCCCWTNQVAMFWFLFLLFWVSLVFYVLCVLLFVCFWFVLLFMEGLRVK